ncbi:MAG: M56 family metallopeptidase [Chitinophagaceae bacterium]|nr:MAG: M56 family metallopeptidase [Chitinophagaceae bacterium]
MDLSTVVSPQIARALSNTFIYSLWQGLLLAILAGGIILLTRKSASRTRYNLLTGSLALFLVVIVSTFIYQLKQPAAKINTSTTVQPPASSLPGNHLLETPAVSAENSFFIDYINEYSNTIVLIWFLIVCARCLQLMIGLHGLYRLRHQSVSPVSKEWEEKLQVLAASIGINQIVTAAESGLAKVPMVIGHLKPVILLPAGLITAMPPVEIEAILLHELAHIRRRDYLVNLLQNLVEIVFFFNPAVLWISSLMKAERENCCDDITVAQINSKAAYIRALLSCQEYQSRTSRFAMALGRRKNLLGRVSRMVSSSNHSLSVLEKSLLTVCLVTAGLMLAAFSGKEEKMEQYVPGPEINQPVIEEQASVQTSLRDTSHPGKLKINQGDITPAEAKEPDEPAAHHSTVDSSSQTLQKKLLALDRKGLVLDESAVKLDQLEYLTDVQYKISAAGYKASELAVKPDAQLYTGNIPVYNPQTAYSITDGSKPVYKTGVQEYLPNDERKEFTSTDIVKTYIVKEDIVARPQDIKSFFISNDELIVNGQKQSDDIHRLIIDQCFKTYTNKPWSIMYNFDISATKTTTRTVISDN